MVLSKSFTLIELLVVVAIIGLMASLIIINYSGQKQKDVEEQAVLTFVSDLRRVQNMAMSVVPCCSGEVCDEYQIVVNNNKYTTTCSTYETKVSVGISEGTISFLPIDKDNPTIRIQGTKSFTIGSTAITISDEGKITY